FASNTSHNMSARWNMAAAVGARNSNEIFRLAPLRANATGTLPLASALRDGAAAAALPSAAGLAAPGTGGAALGGAALGGATFGGAALAGGSAFAAAAGAAALAAGAAAGRLFGEGVARAVLFVAG